MTPKVLFADRDADGGRADNRVNIAIVNHPDLSSVDEVDGAPEVDELLQAAASTASGTSAAAVAKRVRLVTGEYSFS